MKKEKYICTQTKSGREYLLVKFVYTTIEGKKETYSKTFAVDNYPSRAAAMKAACAHRDKMRAEYANGYHAKVKPLSLRELLDYGDEVSHAAASTSLLHRTYFRKYIEGEVSHKITELTPLDIERTMATVRYDCSDEVISRIYGVWKVICVTALKLGMITVNPLEMVTKPKSKKISRETRTIKAASQEEISDGIAFIYTYAMSHKEAMQYNSLIIYHLARLIRQTGIRPAEAFALTRSDVNFFTRELSITKMHGTNESGEADVAPKTELSRRTIPLNEEAISALHDVMDMHGNDVLFTAYNGRRLNSKWVAFRMRYIWDAYGKTPFTMYTLRHELSTQLITHSVDPRTVMELMGHKSLDMTIGVYARSNDDLKREAVKNLQKYA